MKKKPPGIDFEPNEGQATLAQSTAELASSPEPEGRVGPYRLLRRLGEGGMGEVWLAEQIEPVRRRVALKVIKHGMDTKQVLARFDAERQALALMDHPAVARVFEAGSTSRGRPYFVMEYVDGLSITRYCDTNRLGTRERLQLFVQVCEGVQHAHHKAIIHRDLKPSNVLISTVDGKPVPKIIDFGLAKAMARPLTDRTMFTELGALIGTPEYMSPEQAGGSAQAVDTRTDVYSLGVMLYQLLTGTLPFDSKELRNADYEQIQHMIREEEPPRPSTRLRTLGDASGRLARRRDVDPRGLERQLVGDLDWITMKALEKDPARRYGSPYELASDIQRHLEHRAVLAGPPSRLYRAGKFVRRHRLGVAAAAVLAMGLGIGIVGTTIGLLQARRAEARARHAADVSETVSRFLADMLGGLDPERAGLELQSDLRRRVSEALQHRGGTHEEVEAALASFDDAMIGVNVTDAGLRLVDTEILARTEPAIEEQLGDQPEIAGRLHETVGTTYERLGLYDSAERHLVTAVELRERALGREHPDTLHSMSRLGWIYKHQGRYDESEALLSETVELARRVLGPEDARTLSVATRLAHAYYRHGRYEEAQALHSETLEVQRRTLGPEHRATLSSMSGLATTYSGQGLYEEAEALNRQILETQRRVLGREEPNTLSTANNLALGHISQREFDEAERLLQDVAEIRQRTLGEEHPDTLNAKSNLARVYRLQRRYDEAEALQLAILETRRRVLGEQHPETLASLSRLASVYRYKGGHAKAEALHREVLEIRRRTAGNEHPVTIDAMNNLGVAHAVQNELDAAEKLFLEAVATGRRVLGNEHMAVAEPLYNLACISAIRGQRELALDYLREAVDSGWSNVEWIMKDSSLEPLRDTPEFQTLVAELRDRNPPD